MLSHLSLAPFFPTHFDLIHVELYRMAVSQQHKYTRRKKKHVKLVFWRCGKREWMDMFICAAPSVHVQQPSEYVKNYNLIYVTVRLCFLMCGTWIAFGKTEKNAQLISGMARKFAANAFRHHHITYAWIWIHKIFLSPWLISSLSFFHIHL